MGNIKDLLTTIFAIIAVLGAAINAYLQTIPTGGTIDWFQLVMAAVVAIVAYFTGKTGDGKKKNSPTHN